MNAPIPVISVPCLISFETFSAQRDSFSARPTGSSERISPTGGAFAAAVSGTNPVGGGGRFGVVCSWKNPGGGGGITELEPMLFHSSRFSRLSVDSRGNSIIADCRSLQPAQSPSRSEVPDAASRYSGQRPEVSV